MMKKYHRKFLIMLAFFLLIFISNCFWTPGLPRPGIPAKDLRKLDLAGIWYVNYKHQLMCDEEEADRLTEILVLDIEGNYRQIFWDKLEGKAEERRGRWWLEHLPDGIVRIHLEGGRIYPFENCKISFLYPDDLTGHKLEIGRNEAVLQVWKDRKGGLFLTYPYTRDPDAPLIVELHRLTP